LVATKNEKGGSTKNRHRESTPGLPDPVSLFPKSI